MNLTQLGKEIHKVNTSIWHLEKSMDGVEPYVWRFKRVNRPKELFRLKQRKEVLTEQRERIKATTPKGQWYPKRKRSGRFNNRENEVKTQVMTEAYKDGFAIKDIAKYFNLCVGAVYLRIGIKDVTDRKSRKIKFEHKKHVNCNCGQPSSNHIIIQHYKRKNGTISSVERYDKRCHECKGKQRVKRKQNKFQAERNYAY